MINPRNPFNDIETKRQLRNNTSTQRKNMIDTKQGVIINTIPKEESLGMADLRSDYVIPEHAELPQDLFVPTSSKAVPSILTLSITSSLSKSSVSR